MLPLLECWRPKAAWILSRRASSDLSRYPDSSPAIAEVEPARADTLKQPGLDSTDCLDKARSAPLVHPVDPAGSLRFLQRPPPVPLRQLAQINMHFLVALVRNITSPHMRLEL